MFLNMLIKFNILWVEDDFKYVKSTENVLKKYLDNLGFCLEVDHIGNPKKTPVQNYLNYTSKYDLILVDWHFKTEVGSTDEAIGGDVIKQIREETPFADIIFYSGNDSIEDELKSKALTGVYISSRRNLKDEAKDLIQYLLHKTLHPKIMRGIIVSELSNIDDLCYRIIETKYNHKSCNKVNFAKNIKASLKIQIDNQYAEKIKIIKKDNDVFIKKIHSTMVLDSHKRSLQIHEFAKNDKVSKNILDPISQLPETISKRNKIAHWKRAEETDEHILLKEANKDDYLFNQEEAIVMRKNINNAAIALNKYLKYLSDES